MNLDPTDKHLAKKRAREIAELELLLADEYAARFPTLDPSGYPVEEDLWLDAQAKFLLGTNDEETE